MRSQYKERKLVYKAPKNPHPCRLCSCYNLHFTVRPTS